ncbi:MAG: hypothetical protein A2X86_02130 [Bdellovibrionales bacterium GWA2_49_15]|nr:MAG: hypothetical protein A2X86_02130 [Bdellovibrionales bacterium GWA2_49_15]
MSTKDVDNYYNHLIDLNSYLKGSAFHEVLKLDDLGLLSFHWADCQTTCLLERAEVMNSERGRARLSWLDHNLKKLKEIPTWLRGPMSTLHSNLYDTYDNFLEMPFRHALDAGKDVLISTVGEAGPYLPLMSHRWQDKKVFKDFVSKKILTKNMPLRHFRLRANLQGVVYFQGADIDAFPLTLVQMMSSGCLFRWNSPIIYSKLVEERLASFQINIQDLKEVHGLRTKSAENLNFCVHNYKFFRSGVSGPQHGPSNEIFLFVRYKDMHPIGRGGSMESVEEVFKPLLEKYFHEISKVCIELSAGSAAPILVPAAA